MFAKHYYNASKTEVYSGGEEGRSYCKGYNIDNEVVTARIKRVVIEEDSCDIANDFRYESEDHCNHITPGLVPKAEIDINNEVNTEDGREESIST